MLRILAAAPGETVPRGALTGGDGRSTSARSTSRSTACGARSSAIPPIRCSCRRCAASAIRLVADGSRMSTLDTGLTLIRTAAGRVSAANRWMGNAFKGWMPTGLYARALLIMIVPMVMLQSVVAFVFMERHWNTVTRRLSAAVVQDIAGLIDVYKRLSAGQGPRAAAPDRPAAARSGGRFPARRRHAAARAEAVFLAARPVALGGARPARSAGRSGSTPSAAPTWSKSASSSTMP